MAAWRAEHEATVRRQQERDVAALVAVVAQVFSTGREPVPVQADINRGVLAEALAEHDRERGSAA